MSAFSTSLLKCLSDAAMGRGLVAAPLELDPMELLPFPSTPQTRRYPDKPSLRDRMLEEATTHQANCIGFLSTSPTHVPELNKWLL